MSPESLRIILRRFDEPDVVREFTKGRFEVITLHGRTLGRATYEPGWKWSEHVAPLAGTPLCTVEHLGLVLSGHATVAYADGRVHDMTAGTLFYVGSEPHDSWVVGNEQYVSLHLMGAEKYAKQ